MGAFKDKIEASGKSPVAIFHRFRTKMHQRDVLYLFVEGYDDVFFYSAASQKVGIKTDSINCFGKKILESVYAIWKESKLRNANVLFIRDRDFDAHLGSVNEGNAFVLTRGYSVENYVCNPESLAAFISSRMGLSNEEIDINAELESYNRALYRFHMASVILYAKAFAAIESGRKIDLDEICISNCVDRAFEGVEDYKELALTFGSVDEIFSEVVVKCKHLKSAHRYTSLQPEFAIRGKYIITLAYRFLRDLYERALAAHKKNEIVCFNRRLGARLSEQFIFEDLVATAGVPDEVRANFHAALTPATS